MDSHDFDRWRAAYATTSYDEQVRTHDKIWRDYPVQRHYCLPAARRFFAEMATPDEELRVLEIGGWTGDVAAAVLPDSPFVYDWLNVELCRGAVEHPATDDPRYRPVVLDDWAWNYPAGWFDTFDVLFMSHSVEHMTGADLRQLLPLLGNVQRAYVDTPLPDVGTDWQGYSGTHICELSWPDLEALMLDHGFALTAEVENGPERSRIGFFERV